MKENLKKIRQQQKRKLLMRIEKKSPVSIRFLLLLFVLLRLLSSFKAREAQGFENTAAATEPFLFQNTLW
jgi:hypothetical protein